MDNELLNQIHHCKAETLLSALPDNFIDFSICSPPYDNLRTYKGFEWDFELIARESYRVLKPGGVLVWVVGDSTINGSESLTSFKQAIYFRENVGFNLHDTMIYQKAGSQANYEQPRYQQSFEYMFVFSKGAVKVFNPQKTRNHRAGEIHKHIKRQRNGEVVTYGKNVVAEESTLSNVWLLNTGYMHTTKDMEAFEHPAMFPEKLAERHILTWSNPGDTVLDYFMGSGTTAKMARNNERNYIGCDISLEYCELARKRLAMPFTVNMFTHEKEPLPTQEGLL